MRKNGIEYLWLSAGPTLGLRNEVTKCKELLWVFVNSSYCIGNFLNSVNVTDPIFSDNFSVGLSDSRRYSMLFFLIFASLENVDFA